MNMENLNMVSEQKDLPLESAPIFREMEPVAADKKDRIFACLMYLLGYSFIYTFTSEGMEWKLRIFTVVYLVFMAAYFFVKKKRVPKETYFWLAIVGCLGIGYTEEGVIFPIIQLMTLIVAAAYLVLCAGGNLLEGQSSSQWIIVDLWNAMIVVPFYNFFCHIKVLGSGVKEEKGSAHGLRSVLIGLGITIPLLLLILPLLGSADQHFAELLSGMNGYFQEDFFFVLVRILLSLPVTAYLFGLMYGSFYRRNTGHFGQDQVRESMQHARIVPNLAVYTALSVVCVVYLIFMGLQGSYLFSAFAGVRPESYTYAEYARQGFFELCRVAVLNLAILVAGNTFCKTMRRESKVLRWMNVVLSVLTILLVLTAMSKMILYISVFGLTAKRVVTMVFMIWLLLVFALVIIWQFKKLPLVKISLFAGTILYTLLCVLPVRMWMELINQLYFPG